MCVKRPKLAPAQRLICPSYSTSSISIRQPCFTLYQTVYWFNTFFIDLNDCAYFYSLPLSLALSLALPLSLLVSALNFLSYLWWQSKHLKGEDSGHLSRWQSTLAFPFYADIGPFCQLKKAFRGLFFAQFKVRKVCHAPVTHSPLKPVWSPASRPRMLISFCGRRH